ncbi:MAG: GNAT family N-acetyltransferase [Ruminococcus sp.]|nr:GNAT family N-acetyltransferase [Ruminococcus sp.]
MIKQIYGDVCERCTDSYYGKKIAAAYQSYGGEYGFCRFFACENGGTFGTVHIYNSSMVVDGTVNPEDIRTLVNFTKPLSIEIAPGTLSALDGYSPRHRTLFKAVPRETDVNFTDVTVNGDFKRCYEILAESFENMGRFEEWYVDISHRARHGVSELYLHGDTTVTENFDLDGFVFVSHIATAKAARGQGSARRLLYSLADKFEKEGKEVHLFALDHRKKFYETIGFTPVAEDTLYELIGD